MKKIFTLVSVAFLFCVSAHAQDQLPLTTVVMGNGPKLVFVNRDSVYDFGGIPLGAAIDYQFEIMNAGNVPLIIANMKCETGNVHCKWPPKSLKPGKKGMITVTYTAHGDEGSFKHDIFITSNATPTPYPFIHITGAITPAGGSYMPSGTGSSGKSGGRRGGH